MHENQIVRNVSDLAQAVNVIAGTHTLANEALVECYPARRDYFGRTIGGDIFAYQFFNRGGGNCGYYLPDLDSVHIFAVPRLWGLPKPHVMSIRSLLDRQPIS